MKGSSALLTILFLILVFISLHFGYFKPSQQILKSKIENDFIHDMTIHKFILNNRIQKVNENAKSLSSRSMIRNKILDYRKNKISFDELARYTKPKYKDGAATFEDCFYAARYVDGKMVTEYIGAKILEKNPLIYDTLFHKASTYIKLEDSLLIIGAMSPIYDKDTIIGYDFVYSSCSNIPTKFKNDQITFNVIEKPANKDFFIAQDSLYVIDNKLTYAEKSAIDKYYFVFSKSAPDVYAQLNDSNKRQLLINMLFSCFIALVLLIILQRVKLFYFNRGKYLEELINNKTTELSETIEKLKTINVALAESEKKFDYP